MTVQEEIDLRTRAKQLEALVKTQGEQIVALDARLVMAEDYLQGLALYGKPVKGK